MFTSGLVSVSFRPHSPAEILAAVQTAGLESIEWGGDIHVPAGDLARAAEVKQMSAAAGIAVSAYGSYYKLGAAENTDATREAVLQTAKILGTRRVRIWGGEKGSAEYSRDEWNALVKEARVFAAAAEKEGLTLCLECHNHTVTDDYHAACAFLSDVGQEGLRMFWQPNQFRTEEYNLAAAEALAPYCDHLHVFHWDASRRYPLAQGTAIWKEYLAVFAGKDCDAMLEFMHDDALSSLPTTAKTLKGWLEK